MRAPSIMLSCVPGSAADCQKPHTAPFHPQVGVLAQGLLTPWILAAEVDKSIERDDRNDD